MDFSNLGEFFTQLFTALTVEDSLIILLFLLVAFLLGWIFRGFSARSRYKKLKKQFKDKEAQLITTTANYDALRGESAKNLLEIKSLDEENESLTKKAEQLALENSKVMGEVYTAQETIKSLESNNQQLTSSITEMQTVIQQVDSTSNEEIVNQNNLLKDQIKELEIDKDQLSILLSKMEAERDAALSTTTPIQGGDDQNLKLQEQISFLENNRSELSEKISRLESDLAIAKSNTPISNQDTLQSELQKQYDQLMVEKEKLLVLNEQLQAANEDLQVQMMSQDSPQPMVAEFNIDTDEDEAIEIDVDLSVEEIEEPAGARMAFFQSADRLSAIEEKLNSLANENAQLREKIQVIQRPMDLEDSGSFVLSEAVITDSESEADVARKNIALALGSKLSSATADQKDDLKKINGIGPFIENKLNDIGIFTFEQISQLDEELIEQVTAAIEFFPGRIKRDDWVGQALLLIPRV